jgi:transcriptional regulator with XRE-family HTH domain
MESIVLEKLADTRNFCIVAIKTSGDDSRMSIHQRIKDRRLALGMSMAQLATESGVKSWQTVQQWEREGGTAPKRARLQAVAAALEVTQEWLLTGSELSGDKTPSFSELSGLEAQLVMLYRQLIADDQARLIGIANAMANPDLHTKEAEQLELITSYDLANSEGRRGIMSAVRAARKVGATSKRTAGNKS